MKSKFVLWLLSCLVLTMSARATVYRANSPTSAPPGGGSYYTSSGTMLNPASDQVIKVVQILGREYNTSYSPNGGGPQFNGPSEVDTVTLQPGDSVRYYGADGQIPVWSFFNGHYQQTSTTTVQVYAETPIVISTTQAAPPKYTLTVSAGAGGTASGGGSFLGSDSPSISASANQDYTFDKWTGASVADSTSSSTSVSMNNGARSVTATFRYTPSIQLRYTLTVSAGSGGTASGSAIQLPGTATPGISASPDATHDFDGWTGDAVSNSSSTSTSVPMNNADRSVTANFRPKSGPVTYSVNVSAGTGGTASGTASGLAYNDTVSISASPGPDYDFNGWSGSGAADPSSTSTQVAVNSSNHSLTATFKKKSVPPGPTYYSLSVSAGPGGSASGGGSYLGSDTPGISASPDSTHEFDGWTGDAVANSGSSSTSLSMNNASRSVRANFRDVSEPPASRYSLTVSSGPGGSASGGGSYLGSDTPSVSASPADGFEFSGWSGDSVANASSMSTSVPMNNASRSVRANFSTISVPPPEPDPLSGSISLASLDARLRSRTRADASYRASVSPFGSASWTIVRSTSSMSVGSSAPGGATVTSVGGGSQTVVLAPLQNDPAAEYDEYVGLAGDGTLVAVASMHVLPLPTATVSNLPTTATDPRTLPVATVRLRNLYPGSTTTVRVTTPSGQTWRSPDYFTSSADVALKLADIFALFKRTNNSAKVEVWSTNGIAGWQQAITAGTNDGSGIEQLLTTPPITTINYNFSETTNVNTL